ncbi:MAG: hypothetical protein WAX77_15820 [Methylococcaceae bacterium]
MNSAIEKTLSHEEITQLSSVYLNEGRKQENWEIVAITIKGKQLTARLKMSSYYTSATDEAGFHLTIFSTLEFLSQLTIIYAHVWAGYNKKTREGWMVESQIVSKYAIRNPEAIFVNMEVASIKKRGENILAITQSKITDNQGGLFEARLKGFLS